MMFRHSHLAPTWVALAFILLGLGMLPAKSGEFQAGSIKVSDPWVRETPIGGRSGGGYMRITNAGDQADRLVKVESAVANRIEVREVVETGGGVQMRALPNGLEIPPGTTYLRWESYHLLFADLKEPFKPDQPFEALLHFKKAGAVAVQFHIRPRMHW
jgi:copper(I)-binding protein